MYRSLFPFRRLLATTFLVVFVNVLAGQCWCATAKLPQATQRAAKKEAASGNATHGSCHGAGALAKHGQKTQKQTHKSSDGHDCCRDKTASLLSSLAAPAEKQLIAPALALLPVGFEFFSRPQAGKWNRMAPVVLVPSRHLKPKIPDIRIFIQSLTV